MITEMMKYANILADRFWSRGAADRGCGYSVSELPRCRRIPEKAQINGSSEVLVVKRISICLLAVALALFFSVRHTIGKEISNNMAIEEYFTLGYENASFDYSIGARYYSTITGEYDNLLAQYKLAYDAGYGFGWNDTETDLYEHSGLGSEYIWRSPDWMYEIYYLFK